MTEAPGQIIVITGAARGGIGQAITTRLLVDGYTIYGTYDPTDADEVEMAFVESHGTVVWEPLRPHVREEVVAFAAKCAVHEVRGLVNAEFFFAMENPLAFDYEIWDKSLAINLTAPHILAHALLPAMSADAAIVTVTSTEGFIGSFGASAYSATKAAMHNLTKTLANNFGSRGIRVNCVAPGWIGGVMDTDEVFEKSRAITPLARLGSPDEVASVVAFLLSAAAGFINGTVIVADGGYSGVDTIAKFEFEAEGGK